MPASCPVAMKMVAPQRSHFPQMLFFVAMRSYYRTKQKFAKDDMVQVLLIAAAYATLGTWAAIGLVRWLAQQVAWIVTTGGFWMVLAVWFAVTVNLGLIREALLLLEAGKTC